MIDYLVEETEHEGLTIQIHYDDTPSSPREWDNLGRMFCFHHRHDLGDSHGLNDSYFVNSTWEEVQEWAREEHGATVVLPLTLFEHGGLSMSTGRPVKEWDSSFVGFICDTAKTRELVGFDLDRFGRDEGKRSQLRKCLEGEVDTYSAYLRGEVYGYIVLDKGGDHLDSCWGYYEIDHALEEAKGMAEWHAKEFAKATAKANAEAIARTATLAWNGECVDLEIA